MPSRRIGIKRKLMAILLLTSGVVLILTCAGFSIYEYVAFRRSAIRELATIGHIIAANTTAALAFANADDATEVLSALEGEGHVVGACLYDGSGRVFATYPVAAALDGFPATPEEDGVRFTESHVAGFFPVIQRGDHRLGTLYIQSDLGVIYERFSNYAAIVSLVIAISFLAAYLLSSVLQRQISRPVLALTAAAQTFSERRDDSARVTRTSDDEFGRLTDAFNEMLDAIEEQTRALQESEELFRGMAETMPQIVWTSRPDGWLEYSNQRWLEYTGMNAEQTEGWGWASVLHPDDRQVAIDLWTEAVEAGTAYQVEHRLRRASDEVYRWHIGRAAPLRNDAGKIVKWIGTFTDIDDAKRAEEEVRTLNLELEQRVQDRTADLRAAVEELESFSYSVSHDLRAPLRHVEGYVEMLSEAIASDLSGKPLRYLNTIRAATVEMGRLIDDLLDFSRMGRIELSRGEVPLDRLVEDSLRGFELAVRDREIEWKIDPLPEVIGDSSMLKHVLTNLIDNALKYSRNAHPARIEIGSAGQEDGRVVLFVRDNGAGFDMRYVHKLFGVFQRLHRSEEYEGTGIGLATVRRIISRHGGRAWAEGEVENGATIFFTLQPVASE
jgi:PAS domain S-box-containing protein